MFIFMKHLFGDMSKKPRVRIIRKVKHSDKPAQTNAKHGTVLLRGKIEEYDMAEAK
jgi:hypothetical protein